MTQDDHADRRLHWLAWVFVGGAAVHLALWAAINWYRVFGPYLILRLEDVSSIVTGIAPFLLGAAVLVAIPRWPAGRGLLIAGALLSGLHGIAQSGSGAWWAWQVGEFVPPVGAVQVALVIGSLVQVVAAALVPLYLAAGLARAHSTRPASRLGLVVAVAVGVGVIAGGLGLLGLELSAASQSANVQAALIALGLVHRFFITLGGLALVALAVVALRAGKSDRMSPEALIAAGATLAAAGSAASWLAQALLSFDVQGEHLLWVFTVPSTVVSVGASLLVAGFGAAGLGSRSRSPRPDRDRAAPVETLSG